MNTKTIKLLVPKVLDGSVWPIGHVQPVPRVIANKMIDAGEAVESTEKQSSPRKKRPQEPGEVSENTDAET